MRALRRLRGAAVPSILAAIATSPACSSEPPRAAAGIQLHFEGASAKALLDVDGVELRVFDANDVGCSGAALSAAAPDAKVLDLPLAKCADGTCWSGSATMTQDPSRNLTWYVEGSKGGGLAFTGCTQGAVTQDPQQVNITVQPFIPGHTCGDGVLVPPKTCEGPADDACDGMCQTKEEILSNGTVANGYARGNPGRKTSLFTRFLDDGRFIGTWADNVDPSGGDLGGAEITVRRLTATLQTDPTVVLTSELRLQTTGSNFSTSGSKKRSGASASPSWAPVEAGNLLFVFARTPAGDASSHVYGSVQTRNLGSPNAADVQISGTASATSPYVAGASNGDALVVWLEGTTLKSALRKSGGSMSTAQTLAPTGVVGVPRAAWVGGDWVVVWSDGDDVQMMRLNANGTAKGTATVVNATRRTGKQDQPDVAAFSTGDFLVAFRDGAGDVGADIRVQKFDATGAPTGSEIGAVTNDLVKAGDQGNPAVATGQNSKGQRFYAVVWVDPSTPQIQGRIVNADGLGYLSNPVDGHTDEFTIGLGANPRDWPAVAVGGQAPGFLAVGWVDETAGNPAADDDRVRVRRLPLPAEF